MANISHFARDFFVTKFNSSLPISIEVLKKIGFQRYELKVGHKLMRTKSLTPLKIGGRYWGNFSQTNEGILSINSLKLKPEVLQKELDFFELPSWDLVEQICTNDTIFFHDWILNGLQNTSNKDEFLTLTSMLLALNEGIIHLPFKINKRPFLMQYFISNNNLNKNLINFYFAFDTLGSIKGEINNEISMKVLYKKSADLFKNCEYEDKKININICDDLEPIWKGSGGLLDEAG